MRGKWDGKVVYQIYPKSFQDSDGDGIGDLKGIISRLDYLSSLGADLLWICPFFPSPMVDNGYDVSDYRSVDPVFGTMDDFRHLVEQAKERGMGIVIDLVLNHSSSAHPWFQKALHDPLSPYRDYYYFVKSEQVPSNARCFFGGPAWEEVGKGVWYLHTFAKEQPDLNWENPRLREELYAIIRFWLDQGVAGFRFDAITYIKKDLSFPSFPSDGVDSLASINRTALNKEGILPFLQEMKERALGDHFAVAEASGVPTRQYGEYVGPHGCFPLMFDFSAINFDLAPDEDWRGLDKKAELSRFKELWFGMEKATKDASMPVFLENHDQPRSVDKFFRGMEKRPCMAKVLAVMFLLARGVPFIYQGEEIGMGNVPYHDLDEVRDIGSGGNCRKLLDEGYPMEKVLAYATLRCRDQARLPMAWEKGGEGFSSHRPWLSISPQRDGVSVREEESDPRSVLSLYRELVKVRKSMPEAFIHGDMEEIATEGDVVAYFRDGRKYLVACNLSSHRVSLPYGFENILFGEGMDGQGPDGFSLGPYGYAVGSLRNTRFFS